MENNEITLDKIELVKDRTGVSYREAKEALEAHDGNVVDAIISIEDTINESVKRDSKVNELIDDVKEAVKKGNVSKIVVKKGDDVIMNLPVNVGLVGTLLFPWAMLAGVVAAFGTKCTIELFKESGEVVNLSQKAGSAVETVVTKGGVVFDEIKDKGSEFIDVASDKGTQIFNTVVSKGSEFVDAAAGKTEDIVGMAKSKAADLRTKAPQPEPIKVDDLDLSDLDLEEMENTCEDAACGAAQEPIEINAGIKEDLKEGFENVKETVESVIGQVKETVEEKLDQYKNEAEECEEKAEEPVYDSAETEDDSANEEDANPFK